MVIEIPDIFALCILYSFALQQSLTRKKIWSFFCSKMLKCVKDFDVHKYMRYPMFR